MHFKSGSVLCFHDGRFPTAFHATCPDSKSNGVSILLSKTFHLYITDKMLDPIGRFLFLKGTWNNKPITLANVYCPNLKWVAFLREVIKLNLFQFGPSIRHVYKDLFPSLFCPTPNQTPSSLPYLIRHLENPLSPRHGFHIFSPPHNRYARIDFLFI